MIVSAGAATISVLALFVCKELFIIRPNPQNGNNLNGIFSG